MFLKVDEAMSLPCSASSATVIVEAWEESLSIMIMTLPQRRMLRYPHQRPAEAENCAERERAHAHHDRQTDPLQEDRHELRAVFPKPLRHCLEPPEAG